MKRVSLLQEEARLYKKDIERLGLTLNRLKFTDEEKERWWREQNRMKEEREKRLAEIASIREGASKRSGR